MVTGDFDASVPEHAMSYFPHVYEQIIPNKQHCEDDVVSAHTFEDMTDLRWNSQQQELRAASHTASLLFTESTKPAHGVVLPTSMVGLLLSTDAIDITHQRPSQRLIS